MEIHFNEVEPRPTGHVAQGVVSWARALTW